MGLKNTRSAATRSGQHTVSELKLAIGCWYTLLLQILKKQRRLTCLGSCHKARSVEQHRPRREDQGVGHENDGLTGRKPVHVAQRQLEAVPDEREEQHVDVLQVIPRPLWR